MRRPDASRTLRPVLLGLVFLVLPAATLALLTDRLGGADDPVTAVGETLRGRTPPRPMGSDATYVRTVVLGSGDLRVTHWIESDELLLSIGLALPEVPEGRVVEARNIRVVADGRRVAGSREVTFSPQEYPLLGAGSVQVRYRLKGAVERSASSPGRGLVVVAALDVEQDPAPERAIRSILAPEVLSVACVAPTEEPAPEPCGAVDSDGGWSVERAGERVDDRVMAQVSLD